MPVKNKKQIINIVGWGGSGKSVLHFLLDGHPEILSETIHTKIVDGFANFDEKNVVHKDIRAIRKHLEVRGYYNIEAIAFKKVLSIPFSSRQEDMITIPFPFDFYRFESSWVERLSRLEKWSADLIISILYDEYGKELNLSNTCKGDFASRRYVSTMGKADLKNMKQIISQHPTSKTILVKRDIEDIIATRVNRPTPKGLSKTDLRRSWLEVLTRGEIQKINNYYRYIDSEVKDNPHRVKVIDFNDLVLNTELVMRDVAKFLDIEYEIVLNNPSCFGVDVISNGRSYIGNVNDSAKVLLSRKKRLLIKIIDKMSKASNLFSMYSPIVSLIILKIYKITRDTLGKWR
jgi:hypothetical protein